MATNPIHIRHPTSTNMMMHGLPSPPLDNRFPITGLCTQFTDNYHIKEELGSGGFGFVCSAVRKSDGLLVACKFIIRSKIPKSCWTIDKDLGPCPMEALVLKNVRHQNIIEFIEFFQDAQYCYLITYLHGSPWGQQPNSSVRSMDLFECIERHDKFVESEARFIFKQIVDAVYHLYTLGLVHRDIKDENILINEKYQIKIIDFGSVSFFEPLAQTHFERFLGTIQYAAPEILTGKPYNGPSAEVWALGCCLYIILTGQNANQATFHTFTTPPVPLSPLCQDFLKSMLHKNPLRRLSLQQVRDHPWLSR